MATGKVERLCVCRSGSCQQHNKSSAHNWSRVLHRFCVLLAVGPTAVRRRRRRQRAHLRVSRTDRLSAGSLRAKALSLAQVSAAAMQSSRPLIRSGRLLWSERSGGPKRTGEDYWVDDRFRRLIGRIGRRNCSGCASLRKRPRK